MTQLRQRVERLETAATTSTQFGATSNDLANFPGMMNLVAGSGVSFTPGTGTLTITATGGGGTVTSVGMSVPSFLSVSGSPVTTSGTLAVTYSGTALPIANGGSGQTTANAALNAFLPSQATHANKVLQTDGTNTSWQATSSGGQVDSVVAGDGISVDSTDPVNPVVSARISTDPSNAIVLGTDDGLYAVTGGSGASDGSIVVGLGGLGASKAVLVPQVIYLVVPADYELTGWEVFADPAATLSVDVWYSTFPTLPVVGDSIVATNYITTTAASSNTGTTGSWGTTAITRGNFLAISLTANDLATYVVVQLQGDKS